MTRPSANEIRQQFIDYFAKKHGHTFVPSSPCVPTDDPTLMFTNAGMNQFKPIFLGTEQPKHLRVANSQKCIRAGGKHNDLDDVGHDTYHHTFFEMLGNWSFGDYFKAEAIDWAWDLLTNVWGLEKDRLHATYFEGNAGEGLEPDTEARDLWLKILPPQRVHPGNKKDNFWEMGDTGPCGPCSEIHIDLTPDKSGGPLVNAGDARVIEIWNLVFIQFNRGADRKLSPLPAKHVDTGLGFERITAVIQGVNGNYATDLFTSIFAEISKVTGAPAYTGLMEGTTDQKRNTDQSRAIDQSRARKGAVGARSEGTPSGSHTNKQTNNDAIMRDVAYRVIADHLRCLVFAITDGAVPDNEGRGYVLRRILRRAVRYGRQYLGTSEPFMHKLVAVIADTMAGAFPELKNGAQRVAEIILDEEASFSKTLDRGIMTWWSYAGHALMHQFDVEQARKPEVDRLCIHFVGAGFGKDYDFYQARRIAPFDPDTHVRITKGMDIKATVLTFMLGELNTSLVQELCDSTPKISGIGAFTLHDTYGFPIDLTELMAKERGLAVDIAECERLMEEAKDRARSRFAKSGILATVLIGTQSKFVGYKQTQVKQTPLRNVLNEEYGGMPQLHMGQRGALVVDQTPFYPKKGGQVGDTGVIRAPDGRWVFEVVNTRRVGEAIAHIGQCTHGGIIPTFEGTEDIPPPPPDDWEYAELLVDRDRRFLIEKNHTATHILNWALREVLGDHVQQKGSLVDPDKTRFDLSHRAPISDDELTRIEKLVNDKIAEDLEVYTNDDKPVPLGKAQKTNGLRAVFGEKYPDEVRVVSIGVPVADLLNNPDNPEWMQYSVEFCGGTHLKRTGQAKRFRLIEESAVAKGIRRVVGVTGERAEAVEDAASELSREIDAVFAGVHQPLPNGRGSDRSGQPSIEQAVSALNTKLNTTELPLLEKNRLRGRLSELQEHVKTLKKQAAKSGTADILGRVDELLAKAERLGDHAIIAVNMGQATIDQLRAASDALRSRAGSAAVFLASESDGKAVLLAAMTKDLTARGIKAGELMKSTAPIVGGRGGGRPDMAQGGGPDTNKIDEAVQHAAQWLRSAVAT